VIVDCPVYGGDKLCIGEVHYSNLGKNGLVKKKRKENRRRCARLLRALCGVQGKVQAKGSKKRKKGRDRQGTLPPKRRRITGRGSLDYGVDKSQGTHSPKCNRMTGPKGDERALGQKVQGRSTRLHPRNPGRRQKAGFGEKDAIALGITGGGWLRYQGAATRAVGP